MNPNDTRLHELRNVILTVYSKNDDHREDVSLDKTMQIDNYGLKYLFPNRNSKIMYGNRLTKTSMSVIMPKIDDDGNLTGSFFMWAKHKYNLVG